MYTYIYIHTYICKYISMHIYDRYIFICKYIYVICKYVIYICRQIDINVNLGQGEESIETYVRNSKQCGMFEEHHRIWESEIKRP